MNAVNSAATKFFDLVLMPFELIGDRTALVLVSGIFGVFALWVFKHISSQDGIKAAKDRIKGHMIEIRIYQDDLAVVGKAVGKIMLRNLQYVGLNFGPFIPLAIPFAFLMAQFVVRYAYDPIPVTPTEKVVMAGEGTLIEVEFKGDRKSAAGELTVTLPTGLKAVSPLVRSAAEGRAFQEVVAIEAGAHDVLLEVPGAEPQILQVVAGSEPTRTMSPRRVSTDRWYDVLDPEHCALLWPAEPGFEADSPFAAAAIHYPTRDLGWMPGGELGIMIILVVASMLFGVAALKPLGVTI